MMYCLNNKHLILLGNTVVVPYRSHKLLFIAIYNEYNLQIEKYNYDVQNGHITFKLYHAPQQTV